MSIYRISTVEIPELMDVTDLSKFEYEVLNEFYLKVVIPSHIIGIDIKKDKILLDNGCYRVILDSRGTIGNRIRVHYNNYIREAINWYNPRLYEFVKSQLSYDTNEIYLPKWPINHIKLEIKLMI